MIAFRTGALGALLLLPLALAPIAPAPQDPAPAPAAAPAQDPDPKSAQTCGMCHKPFYEEWKGRAHAKAWTDPIYQEAIAEKKRPETCWNCHIPGSVLAKLGRKPDTRDDLKHEGVNCVACHNQGDTVHGPFGTTTDAHPVAKSQAFSVPGSNALCASCHSTKIGPVLPVGRDFDEAKMAEKDKSCVGCHMPEVERHLATSPVTGKPVGEMRKTRRHEVLGPGDAEFAAKAFALEVRRTDNDVELLVGNEAGHRVPGLTLRKFPIAVVQLGAGGKELARAAAEISAENPLLATEQRSFRFPAADGVQEVQIVVDHQFQDAKVATLIDQKFPLR